MKILFAFSVIFLALLISACGMYESVQKKTSETGVAEQSDPIRATSSVSAWSTAPISTSAPEAETDRVTEAVITTSLTPSVTTAIPEKKNNKTQFYNRVSGIYNYCPSIMFFDDNTAYVYYCTNKSAYTIIDYVGCRKGTADSVGNITWGEEKTVLSPTAGSWDAMHTCDPSVIKGDFSYGGEKYEYLMAYLGCTSIDNQDNKVGLAVAKDPMGPFVKVTDRPFVDFEMDTEATVFQWGVGQPSLVSVDKKGTVWLFYTRGDKDGTRTIAEKWDLSDLDAPQMLSSDQLSHKGLTNLLGGHDIINNADFAYDEQTKRFYASSDCHPTPSDAPDFISSDFRLTSFSAEDDFTSFTWENHYEIGYDETKHRRNHNTGIVRDEYGFVLQGDEIVIFYTGANKGSDSLWSYRIYNYRLPKPEQK